MEGERSEEEEAFFFLVVSGYEGGGGGGGERESGGREFIYSGGKRWLWRGKQLREYSCKEYTWWMVWSSACTWIFITRRQRSVLASVADRDVFTSLSTPLREEGEG